MVKHKQEGKVDRPRETNATHEGRPYGKRPSTKSEEQKYQSY
jgi:hypothetical protein